MTTYIPILKAKSGEFDALGQLDGSVAEQVLPLLEMPPRPTERKQPPTLSGHISEVFQELALRWVAGDPVALDLALADLGPVLDNGQAPWEWVQTVASAPYLPVVPVLRLGEKPPAAAGELAQEHGVAVRLNPQELGLAYSTTGRAQLDQARDELLTPLGLDVTAVDLLLDRSDLNAATPAAMQVAGLGPLLEWAGTADYRSVTLAGTSAPGDLADAVGFGEELFDRLEWSGYKLLGTSSVAFGDYAGLAPGLPAGKGRTKHPYLRYVIGEQLLIVRRQAEEGAGLSGFRSLATDLVADGRFAGEKHCAGCGLLQQAAAGMTTASAGGTTAWRTISVTHHITTVTEQLSSHRGP
jgi:hypothetical protein